MCQAKPGKRCLKHLRTRIETVNEQLKAAEEDLYLYHGDKKYAKKVQGLREKFNALSAEQVETKEGLRFVQKEALRLESGTPERERVDAVFIRSFIKSKARSRYDDERKFMKSHPDNCVASGTSMEYRNKSQLVASIISHTSPAKGELRSVAVKDLRGFGGSRKSTTEISFIDGPRGTNMRITGVSSTEEEFGLRVRAKLGEDGTCDLSVSDENGTKKYKVSPQYLDDGKGPLKEPGAIVHMGAADNDDKSHWVIQNALLGLGFTRTEFSKN